MNMRQHKRRYSGRFWIVPVLTRNERGLFWSLEHERRPYDFCNPRAYGG